jgi:molecular chaperone DnaK (HSP70)
MSSEPIIRTDLGTIFSCVAIMRNKKVEKSTGEKIIPSMVCYRVDKNSYEELIGGSAINNMIQYAETTMF